VIAAIVLLFAAPQDYVPAADAHAWFANPARADGDEDRLAALRQAFARANPGYKLAWDPALRELPPSPHARALFVQAGANHEAFVDHHDPALRWSVASAVASGDVAILPPHAGFSISPPADGALQALVFTVPGPAPAGVPDFVRPDWDPRLTDVPGGCATQTGAYRRILLTWNREVGPYVWHAINAHRVRIDDSFTHYHPVNGGFDEFYLVQSAPPGAKLLTSTRVDLLLDPASASAADAPAMIQEHPLRTGDLIYLPRGVAHRGIGGALVQVITVPGFRPDAEIGLDAGIAALDATLTAAGVAPLPRHEPAQERAPAPPERILVVTLPDSADARSYEMARERGTGRGFAAQRLGAGRVAVRYSGPAPDPAALTFFGPPAGAVPLRAVEVAVDEAGATVLVDGRALTRFHLDPRRPYFFPVRGPRGEHMTRRFPMEAGVPGEAADHPHHQGLWLAHGDVNGHDFWHGGATPPQRRLQALTADASGPLFGGFTARFELLDPAGASLGTEVQRWRFWSLGQDRLLEVAAEFGAGRAGLSFGDTKEGFFGIRTHPALRLNGEAATATLLDSAGRRDGDIWGQRAAWVDASGVVDARPAGVTLFDHPDNPRHPTWWHARDYGLLAANPFGVHDFERKPAGTGDFHVAPLDSVQFRWAVLLHDGDAARAQIPDRWSDWAASGGF